MAVTLRFSFDFEHAQAALRQAQARGQDLRPALRSIGRAGVTQTRKRFLSGRGPNGIAWKKGRKPTGQTLIESGLLLRSISESPPEANAVEWGSNRIYAAIHQMGLKGPVNVKAHTRTVRQAFGKPIDPVRVTVDGHVRKVDMPARPYLGVNAQDRAEFAAILYRHVGEPLQGGRP